MYWQLRWKIYHRLEEKHFGKMGSVFGFKYLAIPKKGYVLEAQVSYGQPYLRKIRHHLTFKRVAAVLLVLMVLKMILFPHH